VKQAISATPSTPAFSLPGEITAENIAQVLAETQRQMDCLREQLTETQRLATIGTIAAVIAHEFNNLLTPIVSYSQYALQSLDSAKPDMDLVRKALTRSYQGSEKAGKICASMLGLARGESVFGAVDMQQLVDDTLLVMAREPQKDGIALRVQVQPGLAAQGDPVQLEQVLLNLLINARQAMLGKGGSITIKCTSAPADAAAPGEPPDLQPRPQLRLQVIDTGPGIPEKLLPKIFQPFFTTKGTARRGETKGTGLGLAICKQIVEHHGGRLEVESEVNRGTTFTAYLPAMPSSRTDDMANVAA
jgi:signal transduction histidine kinase